MLDRQVIGGGASAIGVKSTIPSFQKRRDLLCLGRQGSAAACHPIDRSHDSRRTWRTGIKEKIRGRAQRERSTPQGLVECEFKLRCAVPRTPEPLRLIQAATSGPRLIQSHHPSSTALAEGHPGERCE